MRNDPNADRDFVLKLFEQYGKNIVDVLESKSSEMTANEIVENAEFYPDFNPEKQYLNYARGFVCVSPSGNLVKLLQPYDSHVYTSPPEELQAQWGFFWSSDPKHAKPFVESATSPYMQDDCCIFNGHVYKSGMNNNVWAPGTVGIPWEDLGTIEDIQSQF